MPPTPPASKVEKLDLLRDARRRGGHDAGAPWRWRCRYRAFADVWFIVTL